MGKFSNILLTVDFDRTLTAPDTTIPQRNVDAIRYFMDNGGAFTINTGRSLPMMEKIMERISVNAPLLLYNGSAAYDWQKKEFTFQHPIDLDWFQTVRRCMELVPELTVEIQGVDAHYALVRSRMWETFTESNSCRWSYATRQTPMEPFLKFSAYGPVSQNNVSHLFEATEQQLAQMDQAVELLQREFAEKAVVIRAGNRIIDIHCKGVSKGRSARELQQQLGRKILVCVGDGQNDVSMLDEADYAYCPGDAVVRERYENVCDCASGAVADVIYKKIPEILE